MHSPVCLPKRNAFTLIELLVVIAVSAITVVLVTPSLSGLGAAGRMNQSGAMMEGLLVLAREVASSRNTPTAVVALNTDGSTSASRTFAVFVLNPREDGLESTSADWTRISKWETLPEGIGADQSKSSFFASPSVDPHMPDILFQGKSYRAGNGYEFQVFSPGGGLIGTTANRTLVLKRGVFDNGAAQFINSDDFYGFTINASSGRVKITRQ